MRCAARRCTALAALALLAGASGCAPAAKPPAADPRAKDVARLSVEAPDGAKVHVDGIFVGEAPLAAPIDADPGKHFVAVTLTGHEVAAKQVLLERGRTDKLRIELEDTTQRTAAWALIGSAGPVLATGIAFGVLAVIEDRESRDIVDQADEDDQEQLTAEEQAAFDDAIAARDDYRIVSGVAGGTGLGLFLIGGLLFAFDDPDVPAPPISGRPLVGPGFTGASATFRF